MDIDDMYVKFKNDMKFSIINDDVTEDEINRLFIEKIECDNINIFQD
jgi:hypothetical protein